MEDKKLSVPLRVTVGNHPSQVPIHKRLSNQKLPLNVLMGGSQPGSLYSRLAAEQIFFHADRSRYTVTLLAWDRDGCVREYEKESDWKVVRIFEDLPEYVLVRKPRFVMQTLFATKEELSPLLELFSHTGVYHSHGLFYFHREHFNRIAGQMMFRHKGLRTPRAILLRFSDRVPGSFPPACPGPPFLLKPVSGSRFPILIRDSADWQDKGEAFLSMHREVLAEELLEGQLFSAVVIGKCDAPDPLLLPVVRWASPRPRQRLRPGAASADFHIPSGLTLAEEERLLNAALGLHRALKLDFFTKVDYLITPEGETYALEMENQSGLPAHFLESGLLKGVSPALSQLIDLLISKTFYHQGD